MRIRGRRFVASVRASATAKSNQFALVAGLSYLEIETHGVRSTITRRPCYDVVCVRSERLQRLAGCACSIRTVSSKRCGLWASAASTKATKKNSTVRRPDALKQRTNPWKKVGVYPGWLQRTVLWGPSMDLWHQYGTSKTPAPPSGEPTRA